MACSLNKKQALDVYEILYGEIIDRIKDARLSRFDLDQTIKDIYNSVKEVNPEDKENKKALYYAQAAPEIFNLVTLDEEVSDYLLDNDFDFTELKKQIRKFNDLQEVVDALATKKKSKEEIEAEIKNANKTGKDTSVNPDAPIDDLLLWSYNQFNGARVSSAWTTSYQVAIAVNPETATEEEKNIIDPEKKLFSDVVKSIALIARNRESSSDPIMYEDVEIALTAVMTKTIDKDLLTTSDRKYLEEHPNDNGISGIITDKQGNTLYFKEDGSLTDNPEDGRIVYQYLRRVNKVNGKLLLSNSRKYNYNLVEPEILAERQKEEIENNGGKVTKKQLNKLTKDITERQKLELNSLYTLRQMFEGKKGSELQIILPIVSGTLGQTKIKKITQTLQESNVTEEEVKNYIAETVGAKKGYQYIIVQRKISGTESTEPFKLQLQQGDVDEVLAEKISSVLTTKAKLKGRELTFEERKAFFEVYISNSIPKGKTINSSNILVNILKKKKEQSLQIIIRKEGKRITLTDDEIFTDESKQLIKNHLLQAKPKYLSTEQKKEGKKEGANGYYPADIQYNNSLKGKTFTDYNIEGDKINTQNVKHFDAIKKYIKIEYTEDLLDFEKGLNAYLNYTIPEGLISKEYLSDLEVGREKVIKEEKPKTSAKSKSKWKFKRKTDKETTPKKRTTKSKPKPKFARKNTTKKEKDEVKKKNVEDNPQTRVAQLDDIFKNPGKFTPNYTKKGLDRAKDIYLDKVFTSKADRKAAEKWWASSPLSKHISLERITEITNSNAFARWSGYGITLFEGDGGTSVDVYHEAWHGFSQLFLTKNDKVNLYEEIQNLPKYKNKTFFDIEEDLAEQFRTYAKSKGKNKPKGIIGTIFNKIYKFLQSLFGKATKNEVTTDLMNLESVKELYDKLYRASENPDMLSNLTPSMDNVIFGELNRAKTINDNFSIQESKQVVDAMDSMAALIFEQYNQDFNTTSGAYDLLKDEDNKKELYRDIYDKFERLRLGYVSKLQEDLDLLSEPGFLEDLELLEKITDNYIGPNDVFDLGKKDNVISYHLEKSRFKILKDQYIEIEDPTNISESSLFKLKDDNSTSSFKLAKDETMMLLASLFETSVENEEAVRVRGQFGLPKLQEVSVSWNRLAKILQGSYDDMDMYVRIYESSVNYPELQQLLDVLPNPFRVLQGPEYSSREEFKLETAFWQDFKKPRIPYIQLNLSKNEDGKYETRLAKASFDVYQVTRDWKSNFTTADSKVNPYIEKDELGVNLLNTAKIVKDFGVKGSFNYKKANEFLKAIGVVLDESSVAIEEIINSTENPFSTLFGVDRMYEVVKIVNKSNSPDVLKFKKDPLTMLMEGLPESLREDKEQSEDVSARIRSLAEIQNMFSDGYSNFSVQTPEGNRVWEHMVDNTVTRIVTAINYAENWQELTTDAADINGRFKQMRWLNEANNTFSPYSKLLNSIFDLDPMSSTYGEKLSDTKITLQHVAGTQTISKNKKYSKGSSTASMDATSKFLQEIHTMLLNGVEEFMRHASKNTALGMSVDGTIQTYNGKKENKLYVDIESFLSYSDGEIKSYDIIEGYLAAEANRIVRFQQNIDKFKEYAGYNREVKRKDEKGTTVMAGQALTAFDDMLTESTQEKLYNILDEASKDKSGIFDLIDALDENYELRELIQNDISKYFTENTNENINRLEDAKYIDERLINRLAVTNPELTIEDIEEALIKAYTYNSFIHKMETVTLAYGDLVQYNHAKEEFHKRNAGLSSGGKGFRADRRAQIYLSSLKKYYADRMGFESRNYDGTLKTAIIKEMVMPSKMYEEYKEVIYDSVYKRTKNKKIAKTISDTAAKEYNKMEIADGQGWISIEAYRQLKEAESNWSDNQERLYRKISKGEELTVEETVEFFPSYKLQYFGNIESTGLPVNSFHKFSLAPLIPGVAKQGTPLYDLHQKMMKDQIDYVLMESGSKVSHIGTGDVVLNEDGSFNKDSEFTVNTIYAEFLKNQTEVNSEYKGKTIFSTQLRKLILEGLYERGVIKSTKYEEITNERVKRYIDHVEEYTDLLKLELLEEMGYEETTPGEYRAKDKSSIGKLLNMIRTNLEREDVLSDDLIEFIDVFDNTSKLQHDLSFHPEAAKIEKLILSMVNKRVIKQKVAGEPLVQVSVGMFKNQINNPQFKNATKDEIAKWAAATYELPAYHRKSNGYTAASKVMIAMQGTYYNLFNLEYENDESIGVYNEDNELNIDKSLERLNEKIKDDSWLDANNGANRKAITLVGVRIPVQGLNSMEFAEVFEFLPPQAGNIIVPPAEIVAKSGGDFDIDKLTIFMNTLNEDGTVVKRLGDDLQFIRDLRGTDEFFNTVKIQKAALENELINDIKEILELPDNYASLIMPNGTFILKGIADQLAQYVSKYNPKKNKMTRETNQISPTRVLEALYNIYKHESNIVGKKTLGLGAIENTFNVIMNAIGAYMPDTYKTVKGEERTSNMRLRHNVMTDKDGNDVISVSDMYDVDGINKVADVISQMMNGWVDVEKDAWVFFIQGNYEVAPTLLYLIKSGVPVKEAIYFVSNPLVRDYVNEQRLFLSTYADVLGKSIKSPGLAKYNAAGEIIRKNFKSKELSSRSKNQDRYKKSKQLNDKYFLDKTKKYFTESEMLNLIEKDDSKSDMAKAMFLHYLELEQQIGGYTALKMSSNPDTSTKSTISDVEQTEANLSDLQNDSRVPLEIVNNMKSNTILKSFFNGPLVLAISKPLFKLRFHPEITNYLIGRKEAIRKDIDYLFPGQNIEMFSNVFRNDIVSYILQNTIRKYDNKNNFLSLDLETKVPTKLIKYLNRGAFVKDGVLYMDMKQLKKEFRKNAWEKDSDVKNSYEERGLYPLHPSTFRNNSETNFNEYLKFVSQREYIRSLNPLTKEYAKAKSFQEELKNTKELLSDLTQEKAVRYTYEKLIAVKALDNSFNLFHLFESDENAFAIRFMNMINQNSDLAKTYPVLNKLKLDGGKQDGVYNIYLAEKDFDTDKSNLYTSDLKKLSDPGYAKVKDPVENLRISNMFKYLNLYSFLQTGLNKTKLNFTNVVDYTEFLSILENESKDFISALEKNGQEVLDDFYTIFTRQNNSNNINRDRYKDYISDIEFKTVKKAKTTKQTSEVERKGTINVYWGQAESNTSTRILSNLASRKFTWKDREYGSVEHAYQSNKSGTFDQTTYNKYNNLKTTPGYGRKIRGKGTVAEMKAADSLGLMKKLVVESFKQNSNSEAAKKLMQYENFTHNTNQLIDQAFLEGLKLAQQELESTQPVQTSEVEEGVSEVFSENPKLSNIGSEQQYSDYLDTIFPNSKVKEVLYHMTSMAGKKGIEEKGRFLKPGEEGYKKADYATTGGIYFTDNNSYDEDTEMYGSPVTGAYGSVYVSAILNIKNPLVDLTRSFGDISKTELKDNDGFIGTNESKEIGVLEPEQIHILGSKQDIEGFKKFISKPTQTSEVEDTGVELDSTNMDTEVEEKRIGVKLTDESNVYTYNDKNAKNSYYYSNITKNNNDIVFLHNTSVFEIRPEQIENNTILGGSSYFMSEAPNMSINFPTDLYSHVQNGKKVELPSSQYDLLKSIWEKRINVVKEIQEKNGKIAFPEYGFGNKETMPEELFVHLSKRLFEKFQYVNPGSTMYNQVAELIGETEGITDEEILIQLELEEDPFKCS